MKLELGQFCDFDHKNVVEVTLSQFPISASWQVVTCMILHQEHGHLAKRKLVWVLEEIRH